MEKMDSRGEHAVDGIDGIDGIDGEHWAYIHTPTMAPARPSARAARAARAARRSSSSLSDAPISDHDHPSSSSVKNKSVKKIKQTKQAKTTTTTTTTTTVGSDDRLGDDDPNVTVQSTRRPTRSKRQSVSAPTTTTPPPPTTSIRSRDPLSPSYPAFPEFISTPSKLRKHDLELANKPLEDPPMFLNDKIYPITPSKRPQKEDDIGTPSTSKKKKKKTKTTTASPSIPPPHTSPLISKYDIPSDLLDLLPTDYSTDSDFTPFPSTSAPSTSMVSGLTAQVISIDDTENDSLDDLPDLDWDMTEIGMKKKEDETVEVISKRDPK
jgi:hypothetical protein